MPRHVAPATLRPARPEDGEAVGSLCAALARHEGSDAPTMTAAAFRRDGFGANPAFACLIAEQDGRPVGYALHLGDYDTDLMCHSTYVADLYVDKTARRRGIGRALMAEVAAITQRRGGRTLHWNVLRDNPSARAFYQRIGRELEDSMLCGADSEALSRLAAASTGLALRRAGVGDTPVLAGLVERLLVHEGFDPAGLDLPRLLTTDGFGADPAFRCHLAELGGRAVGYALHWPTYDTEPGVRGVYLSDIYVAPAARRGGVARALMAEVARDGADGGAHYLEWEVRRNNRPARAFYASLAEEYPNVLPMIAAGDDFAALAAAAIEKIDR
jgi:ribosomal protein S18 acetylase RimI-like enzyme